MTASIGNFRDDSSVVLDYLRGLRPRGHEVSLHTIAKRLGWERERASEALSLLRSRYPSPVRYEIRDRRKTNGRRWAAAEKTYREQFWRLADDRA